MPTKPNKSAEPRVAKQRPKNAVGGVTGKGFVPGKSGNPKGRPPRCESLREVIQAQLARLHPNGKRLSKKAYGEAVQMTRLEALLLKLEKDDPKLLLAYCFGKPIETQNQIVQNPDGTAIGPLVVRVVGAVTPQAKE